MFERNRIDTIEHAAVPVEVTSSEGEVVKGRLLISVGRNLIDVLNGPGQFFEFEPYGGERAFIAKSTIRSVKPINVPKAPSLNQRLRDIDGFDPLGVLGLPERATLDEVKAAWHRLSKVYHPDRYASADLPEEVTSYLSAMARRVNAAYAALEVPLAKARSVAAQRATPIYESGAGRTR